MYGGFFIRIGNRIVLVKVLVGSLKHMDFLMSFFIRLFAYYASTVFGFLQSLDIYG